MTNRPADLVDLDLFRRFNRAVMEATAPFDGVPLTPEVRIALGQAVLAALQQCWPDATIDEAVAICNQVLGECSVDDPAPKLR